MIQTKLILNYDSLNPHKFYLVEKKNKKTTEIIKNESSTFKDLSPKYWCHEIQQKVFIFHGANDSIVPFTESIQLAEYVSDVELLISYLYTHKEIVKDTSSYFLFKEVLRIIHFFSKFYYYNEN